LATFRERINLLYEEAKDNNHRLTQDEFSACFGATRNQLTGWLDGRGEPDTEMLKNIAKVSGVSVAWLIGDSNLRSYSEDDLARTWPDVINVLRQTDKIPTLNEQRRIAKIIKAALEK
jgi:transcriptional regulator with XRE-family HTH domain